MRRLPALIVIGLAVLLAPGFLCTQTEELRGELSFWGTANKVSGSSLQGSLGFRYIPEFSLKKSWPKKFSLDADFSLNLYGTVPVLGQDLADPSGRLKPYRIWLRFSTETFEARLGLQKISFGSAMLFRPLMWFDRLDPRDPLQITDGVYGLLVRYYFVNNANVWAWGLYGNKDLKGLELYPTQDKSVEYGGRIQLPLPRGEVALTYHHRRMDPSQGPTGAEIPGAPFIPEDRFGLDGKWDIGFGLWFEGALSHYGAEALLLSYQRALTIGLDYTFKAGNGLHVLAEHFLYDTSRQAFGSGSEGLTFSGLLLSYPLGVLDSLAGIFYYDWKNHQLYRFINWQRKYDRWSFYLIGFWNPESFRIYQRPQDNNLFAGTGVQVMLVFNH